MNRQRLGIALGILAVLVLGLYAAGSWLFASIAIDYPTQTLAEGQAKSDSLAELGLPEPQAVTIDAGDVQLSGFLFENDLDGKCGVILLHGFNYTRYGALQYAPLFWERGCDILAYDSRGHGDSSPALHTFGFYEKQDLVRALDWFTAQTGLDRSEIGIVGVSYGAATALQAAPDIPDVAFILADSSYQDLQSIMGRQAVEQFGKIGRLLLPGAMVMAELRAHMDVAAVSPQNAIAQAAMPILLVHSRQDQYTPAAHSEAIYAHSDQSLTVLDINDWGSAHARDVLTDYGRYRAEVADFLDTFVPAFGRPVVQ